MIATLATFPERPRLSPSDIKAVADLAFEVGRGQLDPEARAARLISGIRGMIGADGAAAFLGEIRNGTRSFRHGRWSLQDNLSVAAGLYREQATGVGECSGNISVESVLEVEGCTHVGTVGRAGRVFYLVSQQEEMADGDRRATIGMRRSSIPFTPAEGLMLRAIHESSAGRLLALARSGVAETAPADAGEPRLPPRVRQVLAGLKEGRSEKELAAALRISRHTVHVYVKRIYRGYHVSSRGELLQRWIRG
jgi:DNA-binding CsgD family transcriptional regulator